MGLSNFPSPAEGVLPVLVMNTVLSLALLKNMMRSVLHVVGASGDASSNDLDEDSSSPSSSSSSSSNDDASETSAAIRRRRLSITRYESLCKSRCDIESTSSGCNGGGNNMLTSMECCVCLCRFEADEEVSELACKHFFHKCCLEKWFHNKHSTCPLCRSIM